MYVCFIYVFGVCHVYYRLALAHNYTHYTLDILTVRSRPVRLLYTYRIKRSDWSIAMQSFLCTHAVNLRSRQLSNSSVGIEIVPVMSRMTSDDVTGVKKRSSTIENE